MVDLVPFPWLLPLHLLVVLLLPSLSLHLLHLNGVGLPPPHVQLVVSHAQRQDALVDPQPRGVEHEILETARGKRVAALYKKAHESCRQSRVAATLTGAFLSMGLMTNFLSLKEMFLISLQGKPIFGDNLRGGAAGFAISKGIKLHTFTFLYY